LKVGTSDITFLTNRLSMSLDDKLKNYAKYQLDYERSNALRKVILWVSLITIAAAILIAIYVLGI
jgi:hypothetical protein